MDAWTQKLDALPRMGWVTSPSPITQLGAARLGVEYLGIKRDDLLERAPGGSKVRKIDGIAASAPWKDSDTWAAVGAIGSGHLATTSLSAHALGKKLEAHCFWEPLSDGVVENLAATASYSSAIHFHASRLRLGLVHPGVVVPGAWRGSPLIPPGGSCPEGAMGLLRAALELADQVRRGELPEPERLYVALGSGGTAAGLAVGLGMAGLSTEVRAVATVERMAFPGLLLRRQIWLLRRHLAAHGIEAPRVARVRVDFSQIGPGYGVPTAQSIAACELVREHGVELEPIYTGKAMAALLADAARRGGRGRLLFWHTVRRSPVPREPSWREKLPPGLARRLDRVTARPKLGRRLVLGGAAAAAVAGIVVRTTGYPDVAGWTGQVLSPREALILSSAAEAMLPPGRTGPSPLAVAANVDRFLVSMPEPLVDQIHLLLNVVEHGTTPLGLRLARFSRLSLEGRRAFLEGLSARGGLLAMAARGLRDMCLMGYYQDPSAWEELSYGGPWGPAETPNPPTPYDSFRAAEGELPRGGRA